MASKTMKTLMNFTQEQLLAEITNLREYECTQYTDGGLKRLLARLKKWRVDTLADITEQETVQATINASKKTKNAKKGLVTSSNKILTILHDDLIENGLKVGWITASLDASDARAQPTQAQPTQDQPTMQPTQAQKTLFGAGFKSAAGPTDAGQTDEGPTDAGPTDAGPTDAGQTDEGDDDDDGGQSDNATASDVDVDDDDESEETETVAPKKAAPKKAKAPTKTAAKEKAVAMVAVEKKTKTAAAKKTKNSKLQEACVLSSPARPVMSSPARADVHDQPPDEKARWLASVKLKHKISGEWYGSTASVPCKSIQGGYLTALVKLVGANS